MTAHVAGVAVTAFGRQPGRGALDWQAAAAGAALADAGLTPPELDAVICGYATTAGHLMPADLLAERIGARPAIAHGMSAGGATGLVMLAQAVRLVRAGDARAVLVVGGEDRASGQSRRDVHHAPSRRSGTPSTRSRSAAPSRRTTRCWPRRTSRPTDWNRPTSPRSPSRCARTRRGPRAPTLRKPITVDDVLASRPIAEPLRLLDCCPVSDGGAAVVVTAAPAAVAVTGVGEAHRHQHLSEADLADLGARRAAATALRQAGRGLDDVGVAGIYDSFTVTLAMLLEEIGFCAPGRAGSDAAAGRFDVDGALPLNTHGGLLSYGHCGVGAGWRTSSRS